MKNLIFLIASLSVSIWAQEGNSPMNKKLKGLLYSQGEIIFILDHEYYKLESNDYFEEYYRRIYNDSTIVNPNTELKTDYNLSIIPFIDINSNTYDEYYFNDPLQFGAFLEVKDDGDLILTQYGNSFIDSLLKK